MKPPTAKIYQSWVKFTSGDTVTRAEESNLQEALSDDAELRDELLADAAIHGMISCLPRLDESNANSEDEFVNRVLIACGCETLTTEQDEFGDALNESTRPTFSLASTEPQLEAGLATNDQTEPVRSPSQTVSHDLLRLRKTRRSHSFQRITICCCALILFGVGIVTGIAFSRYQATPTGPISSADLNPDGNAPNNGESQFDGASDFATLTSMNRAIWRTKRFENHRLGPAQFELLHGTAKVAFDNGAVLELTGPAKFKLISPRHVSLSLGIVSAYVPSTSANGFLVETPTSRVIDLGTEFEVAVEDRGQTDIFVRQGAVSVEPWTSQDKPMKPWRLTANGLNRATVFERADSDPRSPIAFTAKGVKGQFESMISINGESMEFTSAKAFENVYDRVMHDFRKSPQELSKNWSLLIDRFNGESRVRGSIILNGIEIDFGELDDMTSLRQKLSGSAANNNPDPGRPAVHNTNRVFMGKVLINGEERTFNSKEEFDAAWKELFEPLKRLGIEAFDKNRDTRKRLESIIKLELGRFPDSNKKQAPNKQQEAGNKTDSKNPFLPQKKAQKPAENAKLGNPFLPKKPVNDDDTQAPENANPFVPKRRSELPD